MSKDSLRVKGEFGHFGMQLWGVTMGGALEVANSGLEGLEGVGPRPLKMGPALWHISLL